MTLDTYKVIIAGTRTFTNYNSLCQECDSFLKEIRVTHDIVILSGAADGADRLGERYALERGYGRTMFNAEWKLYGTAAGPIRNRKMVEKADAAIVFWDGHSKGTKNLIEQAKKRGLFVKTILWGD